MRKKFKVTAVVCAAAIFAGCANVPQQTTTAEPAHVIAADIELNEVTTAAAETTETTAVSEAAEPAESSEDKLDFVGWKLNEAVDALKEIGLDKSYIDWESDNGERIIAKSNWTITEQYISDNKLCFTCMHTSKGIANPIRATGKKALDFLSDPDSVDKLKNVLTNISTVKDIKDTLEDIFVSDK